MKNFENDFTLPPFPAFPSTNRYLSFGPVMDAVSRVQRSVLAREAISLVIGPPGTGKSLACAILAKAFEPSHNVVSIGETSITDEGSFYRYLLHRLGVALENVKRDDLQLMANDQLTGRCSKPEGTVLIIDEAASLSTDVLESIRRMTNLMRDGQPMVSVVLAGGVRLDEILATPSMEPFVQRVSARCYLHPLNAEETRQYIRHTIASCDAEPDETINDAAISAIHHACSGVPRLINQLMTEAIDCAAESDQVLIDEQTIDRAWASLQQLPSPMVEEPLLSDSSAPSSSSIEFGELVDQPAETGVYETVPHESAAIAESNSPSTPDPATLFGEFDDEESIEVGSGSVQRKPTDATDFDIEAALHSQIVSLSQFAAENTAERPEVEAPKEKADSLDQALFEHESVEETVSIEDGFASNDDEAYPSVIWYDEPEQEIKQAEPAAQSGRDDTDLLWITEDIDVERRDRGNPRSIAAHRVDQGGEVESPKLKVDYREMLEKMRQRS